MSNSNTGIFVRKKVDFRPNGQITHLCANNGEMLLVIGGRQLMHYPLLNTSRQIDIALPLSTHDRIASVHLCPSGRHAFVSTAGADNYYLNLKSSMQKAIKRLKGHIISAVGWNCELMTDTDTSFTVIGTNKGALSEISVQSAGNSIYLRDLTTNLSGIKDLSITGIEIFQCEDVSDNPRWAMFVCTYGRLYCMSAPINVKSDSSSTQQVIGTIWSSAFAEQSPPILQPLLTSNDTLKFHCMDQEQRTLPSAFVVHPKCSSGEVPNKFCWVGADGYTIGRIDSTSAEAYDMLVKEIHIKHRLTDGRYSYPLDVALTEYHVLFLYSNQLEAISLLNHKRTFEDALGTDSGQVKGMYRDCVSTMVWVYTDITVWKYQPSEESRDIWRIYLERGEYGKARAIASKSSDSSAHQLIIKKQAEKYISDKNYTAAAEVLVESAEPFELTVLKFLSLDDDRRNGLKRFLELKLNTFTETKDKIRRDALVLWLLDVQLTEFAELQRSKKNIDCENIGTEMTHEEQMIRNMRQQIELFLARPIVLKTVEANREMVYQLMISHAQFTIQLYLAQKLKDFETMIGVYLLQSDYKSILEIIQKQHLLSQYYKHSPTLIERIPNELIDAWIGEGEALNPKFLLPSLYRCQNNTKMIGAALKYLNFAVEKGLACREMHNLLISLCAMHKPKELLEYFKKYGHEKHGIPYDVEFALRICIENPGLEHCSVFLYCVDEMYDEAVSVALKLEDGVNLAKDCAKQMLEKTDDDYGFLPIDMSQPKVSHEMQRKIWLKIARFIIHKQGDIASCLNLMKESNGIIKIQDLLPFFPEFTTIDDFKVPLCECLKEHSGKINELQKEMQEATKNAKEIHSLMEKIKTRFFLINIYCVIRANDQCSLCPDPVMNRPFYAFNCRHFFHKHCLENHVQTFWTSQEHERYALLIEREKLLMNMEKNESTNALSPNHKKHIDELAKIREKITEIIAADCVLCGTAMIESVGKPFIDDDKYEEELSTW